MKQDTEEASDIRRREHWETVYTTKDVAEVGWYQADPKTSLELIRQASPDRGSVIDVGGGASLLADRLLDLGFANVAVLDISAAALQVAKSRLGDRAERVRWVVADVTAAGNLGTFDVWHDRAVFHFLTGADERRAYCALARRTVRPGGRLIIATFAPAGPAKCSGLNVCRYDARGLAEEFADGFALEQEVPETHLTPSGRSQAFTYAVFRRTWQDRERRSV